MFVYKHIFIFTIFLAENADTQDEERNSTDSGVQTTTYSTHRPVGPFKPPLHPFIPPDILRREQQRRNQFFKTGELPGPLVTDQQNSLETKREPEYVSTTTNIFLSSEHTGGMFFSSSSVLWCFFPPAGDEMLWVAVLTFGRDCEPVEWHGSKRVP